MSDKTSPLTRLMDLMTDREQVEADRLLVDEQIDKLVRQREGQTERLKDMRQDVLTLVFGTDLAPGLLYLARVLMGEDVDGERAE